MSVLEFRSTLFFVYYPNKNNVNVELESQVISDTEEQETIQMIKM